MGEFVFSDGGARTLSLSVNEVESGGIVLVLLVGGASEDGLVGTVVELELEGKVWAWDFGVALVLGPTSKARGPLGMSTEWELGSLTPTRNDAILVSCRNSQASRRLYGDFSGPS